MGFIRFYLMVFREAFRRSPDIAQYLIFVAIIIGGVIVAGNPGAKAMLEALDLGGWKTGALILGAIVAVRLLLAPYWLWRDAQARIVSEPENTLDWGLRLQQFRFGVDKKKKAIQTGFILKSTLDAPVRFEVEDILVTIETLGVDSPVFDNMGGVISKGGETTFYYPFIFGVPIIKGRPQEGFASITFKYGKPDGPFIRRAKYVCKLFNPGISGSKFHRLEETESSI